jgi:hypothetical protein
MEGLALAVALVLILFMPMLDPMASFGLAIAALLVLIGATYVSLHRPHAPRH